MRLPLVLLCFASSAQAREVRHGDTIISWSPERLSIVRGGKEKVIFQHREEKNKRGNVIEQQSGAVLSMVGPGVRLPSHGTAKGARILPEHKRLSK